MSRQQASPNCPIRQLLTHSLAEAARAWNVSERMIVGILVVPFVVALAGASTALFGKDAYKWFTGEDGVAETLQVLFYGLALVMSLVIVRCHARSRNDLIAAMYCVLACGLFFLVGEEMSWGQRIFGWGTPEALWDVNKQHETNLHNIHGVGTTFKWIQLLVGAYGSILPLVVLRSTLLARHRQLLSATIPHYTLVPYFLLMFLWKTYRNLMEAPAQFYFVIEKYNEVIELVLSMGFFLFMVFQLRKLRRDELRSAFSVDESGSARAGSVRLR